MAEQKKLSLEEQLAERERHIEHLESKYQHMRSRFIELRKKNESIFKQPVRFALRCVYHKYIKRDWII